MPSGTPGATPATGATSASSVLPALAPRRGISVYRSAANPSRRKFGLAPTPLRLFISPVGVPSGTGPPARGGGGPSDPLGRSSSAYRPLTNHQQRKFGLGRGAARHTNASAARVRCPVGARPSRGEYNSFLSPAQAAGAPTFCDATESRQRTQPRGLSPPWPSPAATRTWPSPLAGRRQRCFAKQAPIFGCRAAPSPDRGGGGSRDSLSRNFSTCGPTSGHPRSLSARLGDSFYFAKSEIVESLFRRGARTHRVFYWPAGGKLHCPRAGGYWQNNSRCFVNILLQQSRAGLISVARGDFNRFCLHKTVEIPSKAGAVPLGTRTGLCLP